MSKEIQGAEPGELNFFEPLAKSAQALFGAAFTPEGLGRLLAAVKKRQTALKIESLAEYGALLRRDPGEWARLWPWALAGGGAFLRPAAQFEVAGELLAEWSIMASERRLRVLSLGCGPGYEVISLAITLEEIGLRSKNWAVDIYGLDLNPRAIDRAGSAVFSAEDLDWLTEAQRKKWFSPRASGFHFKETLAAPIHLAVGNVYEPETWPWAETAGTFDLIFCRELTYEAPPRAPRQLARILRGLLAPTGFIFTAPGEFLPDGSGDLHLEERAGVTYYRRGVNKVKLNRFHSKKEKSGRTPAADEARSELRPLSAREAQLLTAAETELNQGRPEKARPLVNELMLSALDDNRPAPEAWRLIARMEMALVRPESAQAADEAARGV